MPTAADLTSSPAGHGAGGNPPAPPTGEDALLRQEWLEQFNEDLSRILLGEPVSRVPPTSPAPQPARAVR
jgi:hypothetical protein